MASRRTSAEFGSGASISIRAVAEHAGVSTATVSRALRFPDVVTQETRERVARAVEELGYRPNAAARNLRMRRAHAVMVLVPTITNPFFAPIIRAAERVASSRGYNVLLGYTEEEAQRESQLAQLAFNGQVDGILQFGGRWPSGYPINDQTRARFVSACELFDNPRVASVAIDNVAAAEELADFVTSLGHRKVAIVTGPAANRVTKDRLLGVERALAKVAARPAVVLAGDYSMQSGADAADRLRDAGVKPSVVLCFNDEMALGVVHRLTDLGLHVPDEVGVCGFDDIDVARFCSPPLTTVAQPKEEIGEHAMAKLLDAIEGRPPSWETDVLATRLVRRASVAPLSEMRGNLAADPG